MTKTTITSLAKEISDEDAAYRFLEKMRWPEKPVCPHCGSLNDHYFLKPRADARKTRTGNPTPRRLWKCKDCRTQFSVTTGTVMHGSKISLRIWLFVIFEMCANKNGIAAREIERKYGIASRSAWFMTQRIREAMATDPTGKLSGTIVADETYVGGDPRNWHKNDPRRAKQGRSTVKTPVVALIEAESGEVRAQVVTNVTGPRIRQIIRDNVDLTNSTLHTDAAPVYDVIGRKMAGHYAVNHRAGQYITEMSDGTNKAENFFSQLKRSIDGTHHSVSKEHLGRYLAEFVFRHSTCEDTDTARMGALVDLLGGRRLTYKKVAG